MQKTASSHVPINTKQLDAERTAGNDIDEDTERSQFNLHSTAEFRNHHGMYRPCRYRMYLPMIDMTKNLPK